MEKMKARLGAEPRDFAEGRAVVSMVLEMVSSLQPWQGVVRVTILKGLLWP